MHGSCCVLQKLNTRYMLLVHEPGVELLQHTATAMHEVS